MKSNEIWKHNDIMTRKVRPLITIRKDKIYTEILFLILSR